MTTCSPSPTTTPAWASTWSCSTARSAHDVFQGDRPVSPRIGGADEAPRVLRVPGRQPPGDDRVPGLQAHGLAPARLLSPVRLRPVRLGGSSPGGNPSRLHRAGNGGAGGLRQAPDLWGRKLGGDPTRL